MVKLTDVSGIGPVTAKLLAKHNIKTVEALASASLAELQKIPGFNGDIRARSVKKSAADCLQKAAKQMTASTKSTQTTVKKSAGGTVKSDQISAPVKVDIAAGKKNKQDDKKKEKVKSKDKDKGKDKKKSGKKKSKDKKKS